MTPLETLLATYRAASQTHREKGTYFEDLIITYLRNEATYRDLYSQVWTYAQWADLNQLDKRDTGIDLVAQTQGTNEIHAIQCKFYAENHRVQKGDIDSFFNGANDWAIETMKNTRYPLELFQRVMTVSLRTMEIVRGLPILWGCNER